MRTLAAGWRGSVSVNIIDNMLETMEKYGQTLEDMIEERTVQLLQEKEKTDKLLYSLMPRYNVCQTVLP